MTRVDFYHLQRMSLEEVLPKLLSKAYGTGQNITVRTADEGQAEKLNSLLWTFSDESFLPHGSKKDGFAEQQPIWLTSEDDNPNAAKFLFLTCGVVLPAENAQKYERIFNIFDGKNAEALQQARMLWKEYKKSGFEVYYWQQNENGKWEQKA